MGSLRSLCFRSTRPPCQAAFTNGDLSMTTSNITPFPGHCNPAPQPKDARTLAARAEISLYNRGEALRSLVLESAAAWGDPVRHNKVLTAITPH
jgi:hypothetical protein